MKSHIERRLNRLNDKIIRAQFRYFECTRLIQEKEWILGLINRPIKSLNVADLTYLRLQAAEHYA